MLTVAIGVQARSTSSRLPGKSSMQIDNSTVVKKTLKACHSAANYVTNKKGSNIAVDVFLLVPKGDKLAREHKTERVIEGDEHDVLSRYLDLQKDYPRDYFVRVTGDCPLIPPFLITKHIVTACNYKFDYVSNVDPETRTHADGHDCEVLSSPLLRWLGDNVKTDSEREHVTTLLRDRKPDWARIAGIIGYLDNSALKISVDTNEDLSFVREYSDMLNTKLARAKGKFDGVFRA